MTRESKVINVYIFAKFLKIMKDTLFKKQNNNSLDIY